MSHVPGPSEPEYLSSSADGPADPAGPHQPGQPDQPGPDTAGGEPPAGGGGSGRRTALVAGAAVAVVAAVGVGAYGLVQLMAGGSAPASAVPADALAYASLDLDPSAGQKIEAFKLMRKFPGLKKELGGKDDIRKAVFDQIRKEGDCSELSYATDVEPWIGQRIAVAALPDDAKGAVPIVVVQVKDQDKAKAGVRALLRCGDGTKSGLAFSGDYLVAAETQKVADAAAADAEKSALADSTAFTTATGRVGDPGIVTMYASKDVATALDAALPDEELSDAQSSQVRSSLKDFQGGAGVIRVRDGGIEAEFAGPGLPTNDLATVGSSEMASLPSSTAAAVSLALKHGWSSELESKVKDGMGISESDYQEGLRQAEQATGLSLPQDLETLLGDNLSIALDGSADLSGLQDSADPSDVPAGIRIKGDPDKIVPIIDKLKALAGPDADLVKVEQGDGTVAIGFQQKYVASLTEQGGLGSAGAFERVVPSEGRDGALVFVDFDAGGGWAEKLAADDAEAVQNIRPLDALGISAWVDGDHVQHGLFRLTTD